MRKSETRQIQRFGWLFRAQHFILMGSVILAIISGLPMKFPENPLSQLTVIMLGGVEMRAHLHHISGWAMVILGVFHFFYYILWNRNPLFFKRPIMFQKKDLKDFLEHQKYNLGMAKKMPQMGRYTWFEKFDYMGVVWGVGVMGFTGLPMLYMDEVLAFIPLSWLQTLWAAHSEEAMLATLFLVVIHMYHVHFSPEKFPMSMAWLTGKISLKEMKKYHSLELEQMEKNEKTKGKDEAEE